MISLLIGPAEIKWFWCFCLIELSDHSLLHSKGQSFPLDEFPFHSHTIIVLFIPGAYIILIVYVCVRYVCSWNDFRKQNFISSIISSSSRKCFIRMVDKIWIGFHMSVNRVKTHNFINVQLIELVRLIWFHLLIYQFWHRMHFN